jgi:hypothetical protein
LGYSYSPCGLWAEQIDLDIEEVKFYLIAHNMNVPQVFEVTYCSFVNLPSLFPLQMAPKITSIFHPKLPGFWSKPSRTKTFHPIKKIELFGIWDLDKYI